MKAPQFPPEKTIGKFCFPVNKHLLRSCCNADTLPAWLYILLPLVGLYDLTQETYAVELAGVVLAVGVAGRLLYAGRRTYKVTVYGLLLGLYFLFACCNGGLAAPLRIQENWLVAGMLYLYVRLGGMLLRTTGTVWLFVAGGLLQTGIGVLQQAGLVASLHNDFDVTGSFGNPAPWGGYLAVSVLMAVAALRQPGTERSGQRWPLLAALVVLLYGLWLADSRAAWLATGCGWLALEVLRLKTAAARLKGTVASGVALLLCVGALYSYRTASADARLLIWKAGSTLFLHHPWTGTGVNGFAANYMPAQGDYLANAGAEERLLASDNMLAYNEPLCLACEQGVVGFLLLGGVTGWLLLGAASAFRTGKDMLFPPFVGWLVFSCFSYPMAEPALALLFPFFLGRAVVLRPNAVHRPVAGRWTVRYAGCLCAVCVGCFFGYNGLQRYRADQRLAILFFEEGPVAQRVAEAGMGFVYRNSDLLHRYATLWMIREELPQAVKALEALRNMAPSAGVLLDAGLCLEQTGQYEAAASAYAEAARWVPGLLTPRFRLFMLYARQGKDEQARQQARKVLGQAVKLEDDRTLQMRRLAERYLNTH